MPTSSNFFPFLAREEDRLAILREQGARREEALKSGQERQLNPSARWAQDSPIQRVKNYSSKNGERRKDILGESYTLFYLIDSFSSRRGIRQQCRQLGGRRRRKRSGKRRSALLSSEMDKKRRTGRRADNIKVKVW